jgi:hypothetical protein
LLFILLTCRGQFDLYPLSFSSTGSTFSPSKVYLLPYGQRACILIFFCKISFLLMPTDF